MGLVALGFVLAYNPWYLYYLMANGAIGGMSTRAEISGAFLILAISYRVLISLTRKSLAINSSSILNLMTMFLFTVLLGVVTGFVNSNAFIYFGLDVFPLLEMFCLYYIIRLAPEMEINYSKFVKLFGFYIIIMCVTDVVTYIYLTYYEGLSFGALRANIGGTVVNRLMDFIVPLVGPGFIAFSRDSKSKLVRILLPVCVLLTVGLTFYRTAYAAFFVATGFLLIQKKKNVFIFAKTAGVAMIIGVAFLAVLQSKQSENYESDMGGLVIERVKSIFDSDEEDSSISSRHVQAGMMLDEVPKNPLLGTGLGGSLDLGPIQYTSNYFLQILLLLGIPGGVLFLWLYTKVIRVLLWLSKTASDRKEKLFFASMASVLAGLAAVLYFFPYTMYFPLLYLFGATAGIADISYLRRRRQLAAITKGV